jgi:hypothetical protein
MVSSFIGKSRTFAAMILEWNEPQPRYRDRLFQRQPGEEYSLHETLRNCFPRRLKMKGERTQAGDRGHQQTTVSQPESLDGKQLASRSAVLGHLRMTRNYSTQRKSPPRDLGRSQTALCNLIRGKSGGKIGGKRPQTVRNRPKWTPCRWLKRQERPFFCSAHNPKVGGSNPSPAIKGRLHKPSFFFWLQAIIKTLQKRFRLLVSRFGHNKTQIPKDFLLNCCCCTSI